MYAIAYLAPPTHRGVVIMRSSVDNAVRDKIMRQIVAVFALIGKRKLQHLHAGKIVSVTQCLDAGCHHAQVLGNDGQLTQLIAHRIEEFTTGAGHPLSLDGSFFAGWHFPVRLEAPEVIDADDVDQRQHGADTAYPPG